MLSTGQVNDAFYNALGRQPTGQELAQYTSRGDLDGSGGQAQLMSELSGAGGGAGQGTMADQLIKASVDSYTKLANDYQAKAKQFDEANPFNFDTVLANETTKTTARLDPYYKQTLADFLTGINNTKTRSLEDQRTLLSELNADTASYTGQAKLALDKAINTSKESAADSGLYGSGQQMRDTGQIEVGGNAKVSDYLRGQASRENLINTTTGRTLADTGLRETQGVRTLGQEQAYNTQSQSLSEVLRQQQQREFEKSQFTGIPPGVNPQQYNSYNYGLLGA